MIACSYCKAPFEPDYPEQRYCRRNHSLAARRVRAKRRAREAQAALAKGEPLCPRRDKKGYNSPQAAAHTWEAQQGVLVLYRCRCGSLHFGHRFGAFQIRSTTRWTSTPPPAPPTSSTAPSKTFGSNRPTPRKSSSARTS